MRMEDAADIAYAIGFAYSGCLQCVEGICDELNKLGLGWEFTATDETGYRHNKEHDFNDLYVAVSIRELPVMRTPVSEILTEAELEQIEAQRSCSSFMRRYEYDGVTIDRLISTIRAQQAELDRRVICGGMKLVPLEAVVK